MNKIKKFWRENRVLAILLTIVLVCVIVMGVIVVKYFVGTGSSNYGDRLVDIKDAVFSMEDQDKIVASYKESEATNTVSVDVRGKVVYVIVTYNQGISLAEAQSKSNDIYNAIDEKYRKLYDYNVTLKQPAEGDNQGFIMMGARNINGSAFIWSNNTPFTDSEE